MSKYIIRKSEIENMEGENKVHFLNPNAIRKNKSLSDLTEIDGFGFHLVEIEPGNESTEYHVHKFEDECVYILQGEGEVTIGDEVSRVFEGDFIGYKSCGLPHSMKNTGLSTLKYIVVGERLSHDVADYPKKRKRIFRNKGQGWDLVNISDIDKIK